MSASRLWVLLALISGAIEPITVKFGYRTAVTPWQLLLMKNATAAILILPLTGAWRWIGWPGVGRVASVSLYLMVTNGASLLALQHLPAVTFLTLVTTTPALVGILNHARGVDSLTGRFWLGFATCFLGVTLTLDAFRPGAIAFSPLGLAATAVAVVSSTVYRIRMEGLTRDFSPKIVSCYVFLINGAVAILVLAPFVPPIPAAAVPLGLWIGFAGAVANVAFLAALHLVGSTNISLYLILERPLLIVSAALILQESLTGLQGLGTLLVLLGIRLAARRSGQAPGGRLAEKLPHSEPFR